VPNAEPRTRPRQDCPANHSPARSPEARVLSLIGYMVLVFVLSHTSRPLTPEILSSISDKILHAAEYIPLGFLWARFFRGSARRRLILGWAAAALFGVSDELHQAFVPARDASLLDWAADVFGSLLGAWAAAWIELQKKWQRS
jgi:VanZ family protein